jgi:hypothetical protein
MTVPRVRCHLGIWARVHDDCGTDGQSPCFEQVIDDLLQCPGLVPVLSNDEYDLFTLAPLHIVKGALERMTLL